MESNKPKKYFKNKLSDNLINNSNKWKNDEQLFIEKKNRQKNDSNKKIKFYFKKK